MKTQGRFSGWLEIGAETPDAPGVVQLKTTQGLLAYPRGASAMLWYGAGPCVAHLVRSAVDRAAVTQPLDRLRWRVRFMPEADALVLCDELLERFRARFGAIPALNDRLGG